MLRLKATKTSLYKLVKDYAELPPMKRAQFNKTPRSLSYLLRWSDSHAFFSVSGGRPFLSIERRENDYVDNAAKIRDCYHPTIERLRELNMIEDYKPKKGATQ